MIRTICSFAFLTIIISSLGMNVVLGSTVRVTQEQAELIEWCTGEMLEYTDASMVQALNICAEYYLTVE